MNTVLIVEPRFFERLPLIIHNVRRLLDWHIVFYCGKGLLSKWKDLLDVTIEIRELEVNNLSHEEYSDFFKSRTLWEQLYGNFVLTIQADVWIVGGLGIDHFIAMDKSYIGGNMYYVWEEMKRLMPSVADTPYRSFNGGLSLRKRKDMLKIIDTFPPQKTQKPPTGKLIENCAEDIYFTAGCYRLGLPVGDTLEASHFAVHTILREPFFGIHQPRNELKEYLIQKYPDVANAYL